jgi:hypothetical protein
VFGTVKVDVFSGLLSDRKHLCRHSTYSGTGLSRKVLSIVYSLRIELVSGTTFTMRQECEDRRERGGPIFIIDDLFNAVDRIEESETRLQLAVELSDEDRQLSFQVSCQTRRL